MMVSHRQVTEGMNTNQPFLCFSFLLEGVTAHLLYDCQFSSFEVACTEDTYTAATVIY